MSALKITSYIIPASPIRRFYGKDGGRLRIAVNSYDPIKSSDSEEPNPGEKTTIIFVAANGFHKEIFEPIIRSLIEKRERWNGETIWALDGSNQGDSAVANQGILPDSYIWSDFSYDILQVISYLNIKGPIVGVGHSLGGCAMLMAEILRPGTFSSLITIDPVLNPYISKVFIIPSFRLALKRKDTWPNRDVAKEGFLKREFFKTWDPEILDLHIKYGLHDLPSGEVTLKCPKTQEYYTFTDYEQISVATFQRLHEIQCPVLFITGKKSTLINPQDFALLKVSRCKRGDLIILDAGHMVVMEKPRETAKEILNFVSRHYSKKSDSNNAISRERNNNNEKESNEQVPIARL